VDDIVKKEGELDKMLTPWDSDSIIMMDADCFERGCACTASNWAAGHRPECVAVVEYKPWVGLTEEEMSEIYNKNYDKYDTDMTYMDFYIVQREVEAKLREKNGYN